MNGEGRGDLDGRLAVVTGANGGLGGAITAKLASMGARVVALDLPESVPDRAGEIQALACDISDDAAVKAIAGRIGAEFGPCAILVNNAAVLGDAGPLDAMNLEHWDRTISVNLRGAMLCAKWFGAHMLEKGRGAIVNITSIAAHLPNATTAYGPSKAGLLALTRQIAVEWGPRGIRSNAVSPGLIRTPMSDGFYADPRNRDAREAVVAQRRIGTPADIASVVAFLASDAASYVNGQELIVDGGFGLTALMSVQKRS